MSGSLLSMKQTSPRTRPGIRYRAACGKRFRRSLLTVVPLVILLGGFCMERIKVKTRKKREIVDITDRVKDLLKNGNAGKTGICHLSALHTTAALTTADLDPGTDLDMLDAFEHMVPRLRYRHPHDPAHVPDHILSALIGTSVALPVENGRMLLGTWQRVVLVELDGPRDREIVMTLTAEQ
jgi:secondary thiamine-phosphate synthase enzyme